MERQKHGFDYQTEVIERFGLIKDENYTGKWDAYCEGIPVSIKNPKIGLLNIGVEDTKGDELRVEAYKLLKEAPINFVGNIESRELPNGPYNAVITDGFTGNIALKLIEGTATTLFSMLKPVFTKNILTKL